MPSDSEETTLMKPTREESHNAHDLLEDEAEICNSDGAELQDEEEQDDVEVPKELGEPNEYEETEEEDEQAKEPEASEEPSTPKLGDLPDEASAEEVVPDEPSPTSRMNWAALSEFSELEELPSGAVQSPLLNRPMPRLPSSDNGAQQPSTEAIEEPSVADNDDPHNTKKATRKAPPKAAAKKGNGKGQ